MVKYKLFSNEGNREINEDCVGNAESEMGYVFTLADGLGGHGKGEVASEMAVEISTQLFGVAKAIDKVLISDIFEKSQETIMHEQEATHELSEMKTTLVVLLIDKDNVATWGHIGDSRMYHFNLAKKKLVSHTLDHSVPQMLVNIGEITEKDIRHHEDRNKLFRVIGSPWTNSSYEIAEPVKIKKNAAFLLCSDGFWELIEEKDMIACLKKAENVDQWVDQMVEIVKKNGEGTNMDNYSAIAVWVENE